MSDRVKTGPRTPGYLGRESKLFTDPDDNSDYLDVAVWQRLARKANRTQDNDHLIRVAVSGHRFDKP